MGEQVWTIQAALDWCRGYLESKGDSNPRLSAEWLLCEACHMRRVDLYVNYERPLSADERALLRDYVARRAAGEPLQYITGEVAFRHIAVKVRRGVLIPRPETEVLVSEALSMLPAPERRRALDSTLTQDEAEQLQAKQHVREQAAEASDELSEAVKSMLGLKLVEDAVSNGAEAAHPDSASSASEDIEPDSCASEDYSAQNAMAAIVEDGTEDAAAGEVSEGESTPQTHGENEPMYVADICTGSGCIACSIAYENPNTRVLACDIAPEAIALAKENVAALNLGDRVAVLQGNLGEPVPQRFVGKLALVVSNPPYIPTNVLAQLPDEVSAHEPALALDGGEDGLDLFRPLAIWARTALAPGGSLAVELHETCLDQAAHIAADLGFVNVKTVDDLAGRPRVLTCRTPS